MSFIQFFKLTGIYDAKVTLPALILTPRLMNWWRKAWIWIMIYLKHSTLNTQWPTDKALGSVYSILNTIILNTKYSIFNNSTKNILDDERHQKLVKDDIEKWFCYFQTFSIINLLRIILENDFFQVRMVTIDKKSQDGDEANPSRWGHSD